MTTARANVGVAVIGSRLYAVGGFSGMGRSLVWYFGGGREKGRINVSVAENGGRSFIMVNLSF
jgi:hypothetical protein